MATYLQQAGPCHFYRAESRGYFQTKDANMVVDLIYAGEKDSMERLVACQSARVREAGGRSETIQNHGARWQSARNDLACSWLRSLAEALSRYMAEGEFEAVVHFRAVVVLTQRCRSQSGEATLAAPGRRAKRCSNNEISQQTRVYSRTSKTGLSDYCS